MLDVWPRVFADVGRPITTHPPQAQAGPLAHQGPTLDERVVLRCQMAVQLVGWLAQPTDGATLSLAALWYGSDEAPPIWWRI